MGRCDVRIFPPLGVQPAEGLTLGMISPMLIFLGVGTIVFGLRATHAKEHVSASFLAPVGLVLFIVGIVHWAIPNFFPF